jgi:tetratricopeptide (TPR) repeat protein
MEKNHLLLSIIAVGLSFIGGFLLANTLNRGELANLRAEYERSKNSAPTQANPAELTLSDEEIDQKIAEAEQNKTSFDFQRSLGLALYRYAAMKQAPELIDKAIPVLERANGLNPNDYDVLVGLGNSYFDRGYMRKDNAAFEASRKVYAKALEQKPSDKDVRTDLGLTYFLQQPPDYPNALKNFKQNLDSEPKHERSLQFMIQTLVKSGQNGEAAKYLTTLRSVNPSNPTLQEFASLTANEPTSK